MTLLGYRAAEVVQRNRGRGERVATVTGGGGRGVWGEGRVSSCGCQSHWASSSTSCSASLFCSSPGKEGWKHSQEFEMVLHDLTGSPPEKDREAARQSVSQGSQRTSTCVKLNHTLNKAAPEACPSYSDAPHSHTSAATQPKVTDSGFSF